MDIVRLVRLLNSALESAPFPQRSRNLKSFFLYEQSTSVAFIEYYERKAWKNTRGVHANIHWQSAPSFELWHHFIPGCRVDGKPVVMCATCETFLGHPYSTGTTHMQRHLMTTGHRVAVASQDVSCMFAAGPLSAIALIARQD